MLKQQHSRLCLILTKNCKFSFYSTTTTTTRTANDSFKANEIVIARIRNSLYDQHSIGQTRMFTLKDTGILRTKYFDVLHSHIIDRNANSCTFKIQPNGSEHYTSITVKRPSLYEYISNNPHVAVPSQFSILSFVPFLLELDKSKKILESGTGNASMTMFMSQYLDSKQGGLIHTFDIKPVDRSKSFYHNWKNSYDVSNPNTKWFDNVEFFSSNIETHEFPSELNEFYDIVYLDLSDIQNAVSNVYKLLKVNGILVANTMHITQIIKCLKVIEDEKMNLVSDVIIEPSTRLWEIERYAKAKQSIDNKTSGSFDDFLGFKCRVEDANDNKVKRDGLFSPHWPGFLVKFRKTC